MDDLIEIPHSSPEKALTCGSTRVTQKLEPHSSVEAVLRLLEDDLGRCWSGVAEAIGLFPLTTTSGIAIGASEVGVRAGCGVSAGMVECSERTAIIRGWQGGGSRRRSGVYDGGGF